MKLPRLGLTLRTALLSWSVTLATLLIFVVVILPWQRANFMASLESKARGVAVSLREVAAGAAVNEDYSSVVDHCKEMLAGDDSLAYLVLTKNDGFSIVQDRAGWRAESNLTQEWRPEKREPVSGIRFVPLFQQRVFSYSQPFDYSGVQWGWIHVGLSLDAYQQSVARLYRLTAILGIACGVLSLLASFVYARQLVRPLLNLRRTVQRVAEGDLSARAEADRSDELGSLAASVNTMTETLVRRDEILGSVQFAAQRFLGTGNWRDTIDEVLARIGQAARVSRAYVAEIRPAPDGPVPVQSRSEWIAPGAVDRHGGPLAPGRLGDLAQSAHWAAALQRGEVIAARLSELPEEQRAVFAGQEICSLFVIPIMVDRVWWGYLGFEDCTRERHWSDAERDSLLAAADMLGAAIDRQRAQDALLDAKATLEQRVLERTEALQRENLDRQQAEAALARSLSVINATLESTLDGIMVLDRDGRVKHFNRRFVEMLNIAPADLTSGHNRKILAGVAAQLKDPKAFIKKSLKLHIDPETESFDLIEFKDGRIFERYTRPQQADSVSAGRVWCYRDITERKRAEAEIGYERDLLQTLMDNLPDSLYFKDRASRFVRVSRSKVDNSLARLRARHDLGQPPGSPGAYPPHLRGVAAMDQWLRGRTDFDVFPEESARLCFAEEQAIIRSGQPLVGKIESTPLPAGGCDWHLVTKMPWRDGEGRIVGTYGISKNITAIKETEEKLRAVHEELMQASRLAGMAEVATGVLHNVGNVLNSVNVSATLVREKLQASEVASLGRVAELLRRHGGDLGEFLTADPKGKLIPGFVIQLADHLAEEHAVMDAEHEQLARNVEHIKEIVAMQQTYARVSGVLETVRIADVLEDALQINTAGLARHRVEVVRQFADVPAVLVDKHKLMQILVNLIHNAKYALDESPEAGRRIILGIERRDGDRIGIFVTDNGVGIPPENLTRVFSHGFTTRRNGHGFGLHSGAIAAREMGGLLRAESAGPGRGATFTLELPLAREATHHE